MTLLVIPTSGVARRRAKAVRNAEAADEMRFYIDGTIPRHAIAVSMCPCGYRSWLSKRATDEDREAFDRDNDDHGTYCEVA